MRVRIRNKLHWSMGRKVRFPPSLVTLTLIWQVDQRTCLFSFLSLVLDLQRIVRQDDKPVRNTLSASYHMLASSRPLSQESIPSRAQARGLVAI